jgi:hypothetical protein
VTVVVSFFKVCYNGFVLGVRAGFPACRQAGEHFNVNQAQMMIELLHLI